MESIESSNCMNAQKLSCSKDAAVLVFSAGFALAPVNDVMLDDLVD